MLLMRKYFRVSFAVVKVDLATVLKNFKTEFFPVLGSPNKKT